jgi:hypothetical protein
MDICFVGLAHKPANCVRADNRQVGQDLYSQQQTGHNAGAYMGHDGGKRGGIGANSHDPADRVSVDGSHRHIDGV